MPAYNFKAQFAEPVARGQKSTTIRPVRKNRPTRAGDLLYLYTGMRQKGCRLLRVCPCIGITPIKIYSGGTRCVTLNNSRWGISLKEVNQLAVRDGFKGAKEFFAFFFENYGPSFQGELIEWAL